MHDAARAVLPGARIAYVDNDPVAALHTQAILAGGDDGVVAVDADLADPASVLAHPATLRVLDLAEPAGIILGSVGHFLSPAVLRDLVGEYLSRCAVGSWLIISLGRAEDDEPEETLQPAYTAAQTYRYSPSDFAALFAATAVVPPGLREARAWVAGKASPPPSKGLFMHCGAGIKRALLGQDLPAVLLGTQLGVVSGPQSVARVRVNAQMPGAAFVDDIDLSRLLTFQKQPGQYVGARQDRGVSEGTKPVLVLQAPHHAVHPDSRGPRRHRGGEVVGDLVNHGDDHGA
jgi:hypothetical protein